MERYKIIWKDTKEYWKEEKAFVFFYLCSLILYLVSFMFCYGNHPWDKGIAVIFTNGDIGILQGSILAGYLFIWHYGLEERKSAWQSLLALGMKKRDIFMALRGEMMVFQMFAVFFAFLFGMGYHICIEHVSVVKYLFNIALSCLEIQILCGIGEMIFMNRR